MFVLLNRKRSNKTDVLSRIVFFIFLLLLPVVLFSQDRIARLTYSIIDTSSSQTAQVEAIYIWITNNIDYDVKQYQKGNHKYYAPEQVLYRRKALCQGYAELFSEMCRRIGVECYVINGYSKGFGYVKGEPFFRANHSWNICYADSSWLIVDATYGGGFLDYDYSTVSKVRIALTGSDGIRTKFKFVPRPTNDYFAILPERAIETHFPLDSRWQLLPMAVPYGNFAFDSTLVGIPIDFEGKTYQTRLKSIGYNCFVDGINSVAYNPNNHFDAAYQYYRQAIDLSLGIGNRNDSLKQSLLDTTIRYNEQSLIDIKEFRDLRRDGYSDKRLRQGQIYRDAGKSIRGLGRIASTPNGKYPKEEKRLLRVERSLEKAKGAAAAGKKSYASGIRYSFEPTTKRDTSSFADLRKQNSESFTTYTFHRSIVENKLAALADILDSDTLSNEGIIPHLDSVTTRLLTVRQALDEMDEFSFFAHCDSLTHINGRYDTSLATKTKVKVNLALSFGEFNQSFSLAEMALKKILRSYERMAKKSGDNEKYTLLASPIARHLNQLYIYKIQAVGLMARNNRSWQQLADMQDNEVSVFGANGISTIHSRMEQFYSYVGSRTARMYEGDMVLAESIKNGARTNLSAAKQLAKQVKKEQMVAKKRR